MLIPIVIEPRYNRSMWCDQTKAGIEAEVLHKKYQRVIIDSSMYQYIDYDKLLGSQERMIIVIGTSSTWISQVLNFYEKCNIDVILISYQPPEYIALRGVVQMDYVAGMYILLNYLYSCGKTRVALYGFYPISLTDQIKEQAFIRFMNQPGIAAPGKYMFSNTVSLAQCYHDFSPHQNEYDAIICANDIVAASLINNLRHDGVIVPDSFFVASFGNSEISRLFHPGITSVSLDHTAVGRQAISLYSYLSHFPSDVTATIRVKCKLFIRESTNSSNVKYDSSILEAVEDQKYLPDFYADPEVHVYLGFESLLSSGDDLDMEIISGLLNGESYEHLSERLNTTLSTLRYRIRKMISMIGLNSRKEMLDLFNKYNFRQLLTLPSRGE